MNGDRSSSMAAHPDMAFRKRTLSIAGFLLALLRLLGRLGRLLAIYLTKRRIRPPWREATWLAVSEVNGCRFCTYIHEGMAGAAGLSPDNIELLMATGEETAARVLEERETLAVAYAKIWAETAGSPPAGMCDQLGAALTDREVDDLHALLTVIDFANRSGNTLESLLHRMRHPRRLLQLWGALNDLVVGIWVALFGWPALIAGAIQRWRNRRRRPARVS